VRFGEVVRTELRLARAERVSEAGGGRFGGDGIDVDARAQLEAGDSGGSREDLQMPVVRRVVWEHPRGRANYMVIRRLVEQRFERTNQAMHGARKLDNVRV
jgi:hypothetical protein